MSRANIGAVSLLTTLLGACAFTGSAFEDWRDFTHSVDVSTAAELRSTRDTLALAYDRRPTDDVRLRLAYVVSRPESPLQDRSLGRRLLSEVETRGAVGVLKDQLSRELDLAVQLDNALGRVAQLEDQLDAIKQIESELAPDPVEGGDLPQ